MGEVIIRNWDIREFCVRVNWPSVQQQVQVPIWGVITPIRGHPNRIRQVLPLISHIRSYSPHRSHLHPPSLSFLSTIIAVEHQVKSSLSISSMSWWEVDTEYSIHRVQHTPSTSIHWVQQTPSTAFTQDCLSSLHSHDYELITECSFKFRPTSQHNRPLSASSPWELKSKFTCQNPTVAS